MLNDDPQGARDVVDRAFVSDIRRVACILGLSGEYSVGQAISQHGWSVGSVGRRDFIYNGKSTRELSPPSGFEWMSANGINRRSDVVGNTRSGGARVVGWMLSKGKLKLLGTLGGTRSVALAVNDRAQVVGYSDLPGDRDHHAFIAIRGKMTDLNSLLPAHSGWELRAATAINNHGQIVGDGDHNGKRRAWLLTLKR